MSATCACAAELDALKKRLTALEEHATKAAPVLNEHEDRLDKHERQLREMVEDMREIRRTVSTLAQTANRLADFATVQGISLERIERQQGRVVQLLEQLADEKGVTSALEFELAKAARHG